MPANRKARSDWHDLLASAARLQREVPGAVLVGGAAVALLAGHRYSTDADHVVTDLKDRYHMVRRHLESLEGWSTSRASRPPVLILGSLDGKAAGVRQLKRPVPLETQVVHYAGQILRIPTYHELLRIKAYLVLARNYTRDYVDFLVLASALEPEGLEESLATLDHLYGGMLADEDVSGNGMLFDLGMALKQATPKGTHNRDWAYFDAMEPDRRPWDLERIRHEGQAQGDRVLTLWEYLGDGQLKGETSPKSETPKDIPNPSAGLL